MPKVAGKVIKSKIEGGKMLAIVELNGKLPQKGQALTIKWGSLRNRQQNSLLWVYYNWLIKHGGMKEQGFFCAESLHSSMKAHFISEKKLTKGQWEVVEEGTSTLLNKSEFGEFINQIDMFICDFFEISTADFWQDYQDNYQV